MPVGTDGTFDATVPPYEGMLVFDANHQIIRDLKERTKPFVLGTLLRHETYDHPYPHCWRCGNPLIQRAVDSWFVQVTAFRDRMVELNREITWVPAHIRTASSASGWRARSTGRSPATATGARRSRCG